MKLKLINNKEKYKVILKEYSDTVIYYRRITTEAYQAIMRNHMAKGKYDGNAAVIECLGKYIISWEGVVDESGKELSFDPKYVQYLTDEAQAELSDCIRGMGNSGGELVAAEKEKK